MLRPVTTVLLVFALGVLPALHDVCGPECAMGEAPVRLAVAEAGDASSPEDGAECPLHPAEDDDGCTHDHSSVRQMSESTSALVPTLSQSLDLPVAAFSGTSRPIAATLQGHAVVSPPVDRAPQRLALRV